MLDRVVLVNYIYLNNLVSKIALSEIKKSSGGRQVEVDKYIWGRSYIYEFGQKYCPKILMVGNEIGIAES